MPYGGGADEPQHRRATSHRPPPKHALSLATLSLPASSSGLLPHQLQHRALGTQAEETRVVPSQALGVEFPPRCPPPAGSPWVPGRSQLHMVLRAPSSSPSFVRELHLQEGVLGTAVAQSVLPQPRETLRFRGRQHQTRKGRIDLWADVLALSGSPKPGQDALSYQPSSISSAPCAGLWQIQVLARVLVLGGNITPNEQRGAPSSALHSQTAALAKREAWRGGDKLPKILCRKQPLC